MRAGWKTRGRCHVFGDDIAHDNGMMEWKHIIERQTDPAVLIPRLFAAIDPEFVGRVQPGDFIIAGQRFGTGKGHTTAYIAMEALDLRILCESTFDRVIRGTVNSGLPLMANCPGITSVLAPGEEIEVDMSTGELTRVATGERHDYAPVPAGMRQIVEDGGRKGFLQKWLATHPELGQPLPAPT